MTRANLAKTANSWQITREIRALQRNPDKAQSARKFHVAFQYRKHLSSDKGNISIKLTYGSQNILVRSTGVITRREKLGLHPITIHGDTPATISLRNIEAKAHALYYEMKLSGVPIDLNVIANLVLDRAVSYNSLSLENALNEFFSLRVKEYEAGLIHITNFQKQRAWNRYFHEFAIKRYRKNVQVSDIAPADAERFLLHLLETKKFDHNYSVHILMHAKRFLKWAWQSEYINRNPFDGVKKTLKKKPICFLTEKELESLINVSLFPVTALVRDMFLLQCFTGLAWRDLADLRPHNIGKLNDQDVIIKERQKTKVASYIPVTATVLQIIAKYRMTPEAIRKGTLLPVHPNQKFNHYLKIIAEAAGIKKRLTSHIGRKTFATLTQNNGANIQSISKALGHTNTAVTERHYAVFDPSNAVLDIRNAVTRIEGNLKAKAAI